MSAIYDDNKDNYFVYIFVNSFLNIQYPDNYSYTGIPSVDREFYKTEHGVFPSQVRDCIKDYEGNIHDNTFHSILYGSSSDLFDSKENLDKQLEPVFKKILDGFPFDSERSYDVALREELSFDLFDAFSKILKENGLFIDSKEYEQEFRQKKEIYPNMNNEEIRAMMPGMIGHSLYDIFKAQAFDYIDNINLKKQLTEIHSDLEEGTFIDDWTPFDEFIDYQDIKKYGMVNPYSFPLYCEKFNSDKVKPNDNFHDERLVKVELELYCDSEISLADDKMEISYLKPSIVVSFADYNFSNINKPFTNNFVEQNRVSWDSVYDFLEDAPKFLGYEYIDECIQENPYENPAVIVSDGRKI